MKLIKGALYILPTTQFVAKYTGEDNKFLVTKDLIGKDTYWVGRITCSLSHNVPKLINTVSKYEI